MSNKTQTFIQQHPAGSVINDKTVMGYTKDNGSHAMVNLKCNVCDIEKSVRVLDAITYNGLTTHGTSCNRRDVTISGNLINNPELGIYGKKLHTVFNGIHYRCENHKCNDYDNYGGRGISVSPEFSVSDEGYQNFIDHCLPLLTQRVDECIENGTFDNKEEALYGNKALSIDRVDCNGNYEPNNIRWATKDEQTQNRRTMPVFIAVDPNLNVYLSNNQIRFANEYGLNDKCINDTLRGRHATHNGWRFYYMNYLFYFDFNKVQTVDAMY